MPCQKRPHATSAGDAQMGATDDQIRARRLGQLDRLRAEPQDEPPLPDAAVAGKRNRNALAVPQTDALLGRQRDAEEPVHLGGMAEVVEVEETCVAHLEPELERVGCRRTMPGEETHRARA